MIPQLLQMKVLIYIFSIILLTISIPPNALFVYLKKIPQKYNFKKKLPEKVKF